MADRMAAEIWIGGKVSSQLADQLAYEVACERVALEWGEVAFDPSCGSDLLGARTNLDGATVLWLCDDQACGGVMEGLEEFLLNHAIPYRRRSDGKYEFDPELIEFRPDLGWSAPQGWITNAEGEPVVPVSFLRPIAEALAKSIVGQECDLRGAIERATAELSRLLPPDGPPLPEFQIEISAFPDAAC